MYYYIVDIFFFVLWQKLSATFISMFARTEKARSWFLVPVPLLGQHGYCQQNWGKLCQHLVLPHKLPKIHTANHATIPIQKHKITVQICGNFWGAQYMIKRGYFLYLLLAKSTWPRRFVGYASMELSTLIRQDGRKSRKLYAAPNKQIKPKRVRGVYFLKSLNITENICETISKIVEVQRKDIEEICKNL